LPSSSSSPPPPSPSSPLSLHDALPICPAHQRPHPLPLGSEDECEAAREVDVPHRRRVHVGRVRPEVGALHIVQVAREVLHDGDREVLDRAGRGTADDRCDPCGAMLGNDDARRARALCAATDRAEIAGIGNAVEASKEWLVTGRELVCVRVAIRLYTWVDILVIAWCYGLG